MLGRRRRIIALACAAMGMAFGAGSNPEPAAAAAMLCDPSIYFNHPGCDDGELEYTFSYECEEVSPQAGCYYSPGASAGCEYVMFTCSYPHYVAGECDNVGCRQT